MSFLGWLFLGVVIGYLGSRIMRSDAGPAAHAASRRRTGPEASSAWSLVRLAHRASRSGPA